MQLLQDAVIIIIKILIAMGDVTLLVLASIIGIFKKIIKRIVNSVKLILRFFTRFKRFKIRFKKDKVLKPKIKKIKKAKPIKIFPLPFFTKVKYFLIGSVFSAIFIFLPLLFLIFLQDLPSPIILSLQDTAQTTKIYDRNGVLLYQIYANQNRTFVPLSSIPTNLQQATIAIEDKDFYSNPGFNIGAILRAAIANLSGKPLQGGSTITQQLIKSTLLTPEVSITRKIKEVILAFWAERIYTKDQILQMYLNQIPYGGTSWGIEAASDTYFGKHAKDLDLAQSTFLAGLPNAPTFYSPYGEYPDLWKKRQKEVLAKMAEQKFITKGQAEDAAKEELSFQPIQNPIHAPHFVMYVKDLLVKKYGLPIVEKGGLQVVTTLDLKTQDTAEKIVKEEVENNRNLNLTNGASLVTNPKNGDIIAMVGSHDYSDPNGGNFNVTLALRQPGSSIKVVTYSAALSASFTAATTIDDSPIAFTSAGSPSYSPVNYDGRFRGLMTLRLALANSINIPAVKTLNTIGIPAMVELGKKMGISTWKEPGNYGLSITLGGADVKMTDMAAVYGVLANQGNRVNLNPILKITDYRGDILEEKKLEKKKVLDPGITFIISDILSDNQARAMGFGTNSPLIIQNHTVSVKTGTSDNKRDNWTIGYTPSYLVAVWVGNNDNSPMSQTLASGITGAAPIWRRIMENLISSKPDEKMPVPENIIQKSCLGRNEYFIKGTENFVNCNIKRITPTPMP
ncbi:MAG: PBP1A family penicillin-binding protein [Patescibacteria group bacterium]